MNVIDQTIYYDLIRDGHDYFREAGYERNNGAYLKARNLFLKAKCKFQEANEMAIYKGNNYCSLFTEINACETMYAKMEELLISQTITQTIK